MVTLLAARAAAATCVDQTGLVDLACLGGAPSPLELREHSVGGPMPNSAAWVRARYPALATCLAALPAAEGATRYELELDATLTIARAVRDPSPEVTAEIDACVEGLFVGQRPPGATNHTNPVHFTLSYRRRAARPTLAADLDRLCAVAGRLAPGAPLSTLVTAWSVDARGASLLGEDAAALLTAVEREPRDHLYAAIVREAAARGPSWTCPALEAALRP